ncbi:hypothetical protein TNCV_2164181 [Trichonephila clavipes]|nr:hypothetical protein TNCV_2164181 [Trichonephila clavipes]
MQSFILYTKWVGSPHLSGGGTNGFYPLVHVEIKSRPASDVLGGRCEHQFATGIHNSTKGSCVRPRFSKVLARGGCDYYFAPTISISPSSQQNRGRSS